MEIRPLDYDGDAEQQWVDTDLLVRRYGDHVVATLSDQFTGDAESLTDLLVHMSKQYVNQKYTEPWEQRLKCAVIANRALGDEDAAFQTELDIMARKFLNEQRSRPHGDHFEVKTAEGIISWTRKPKEPEHAPEECLAGTRGSDAGPRDHHRPEPQKDKNGTGSTSGNRSNQRDGNHLADAN